MDGQMLLYSPVENARSWVMVWLQTWMRFHYPFTVSCSHKKPTVCTNEADVDLSNLHLHVNAFTHCTFCSGFTANCCRLVLSGWHRDGCIAVVMIFLVRAGHSFPRVKPLFLNLHHSICHLLLFFPCCLSHLWTPKALTFSNHGNCSISLSFAAISLHDPTLISLWERKTLRTVLRVERGSVYIKRSQTVADGKSTDILYLLLW